MLLLAGVEADGGGRRQRDDAALARQRARRRVHRTADDARRRTVAAAVRLRRPRQTHPRRPASKNRKDVVNRSASK